MPVVREVFPYLCVRGASAAIDFYARVFGAEEGFRLEEPGGRVAHAELRLGPATLMLALRDPFGHEWLLGHEIERVSPEEMRRRFQAEHA